MEQDSSPGRPSTSTTGKSSLDISEDSIINRKREYRGLPASFSSNLGRIRPSPREKTPEKKTLRTASGSQVKDIVAWLESSTDKPTSERSNDAASSRRSISSSTAVSNCPPHQATALQPLKNVPGVEEYSLTLLKYRQYYDVPLGRCLDRTSENGCASGKSSRSSRVPSSNGSDVGTNAETPKHSAKNKPPRRFRRDLHEVREFWKNVKEYLWISDEELERGEGSPLHELELSGKHKVPTQPATSQPRNTMSSTTSSKHKHHPSGRKSNSTAHSSSRGSTLARPPRVWSVEEKMSEIDAFFDEEPSNVQQTPVTVTSGVGTSQGTPEVHAQRCGSCLKLKTNSSSSGQAFNMI